VTADTSSLAAYQFPLKIHLIIISVVQKAGQNMEHTLIAAYVAMLIGYLIIDNEVS